jgi:hypothetical protein
MTIDKHRGIHRSRRRTGNPINSKPRLLEQTIEHAPSKCPVRATALQGKIDKDGIAGDGGLGRFTGHWTSRKLHPRRRPTNRQYQQQTGLVPNRWEQRLGRSGQSPIPMAKSSGEKPGPVIRHQQRHESDLANRY